MIYIYVINGKKTISLTVFSCNAMDKYSAPSLVILHNRSFKVSRVYMSHNDEYLMGGKKIGVTVFVCRVSARHFNFCPSIFLRKSVNRVKFYINDYFINRNKIKITSIHLISIITVVDCIKSYTHIMN